MRRVVLCHQLGGTLQRLAGPHDYDGRSPPTHLRSDRRGRARRAAATRSRSQTIPQGGPASPLPLSTTTQWTCSWVIVAATSERGASRSQLKTPWCIASTTRSVLMRGCDAFRSSYSSLGVVRAVQAQDRGERGAGHRRCARLRLRGTPGAAGSIPASGREGGPAGPPLSDLSRSSGAPPRAGFGSPRSSARRSRAAKRRPCRGAAR